MSDYIAQLLLNCRRTFGKNAKRRPYSRAAWVALLAAPLAITSRLALGDDFVLGPSQQHSITSPVTYGTVSLGAESQLTVATMTETSTQEEDDAEGAWVSAKERFWQQLRKQGAPETKYLRFTVQISFSPAARPAHRSLCLDVRTFASATEQLYLDLRSPKIKKQPSTTRSQFATSATSTESSFQKIVAHGPTFLMS